MLRPPTPATKPATSCAHPGDGKNTLCTCDYDEFTAWPSAIQRIVAMAGRQIVYLWGAKVERIPRDYDLNEGHFTLDYESIACIRLVVQWPMANPSKSKYRRCQCPPPRTNSSSLLLSEEDSKLITAGRYPIKRNDHVDIDLPFGNDYISLSFA